MFKKRDTRTSETPPCDLSCFVSERFRCTLAGRGPLWAWPLWAPLGPCEPGLWPWAFVGRYNKQRNCEDRDLSATLTTFTRKQGACCNCKPNETEEYYVAFICVHIHPETRAWGRYRDQQKSKMFDLPLCLTGFTRKKAPAAAIKTKEYQLINE